MIYTFYGHKYNKLYYICEHTDNNNKTMKYKITFLSIIASLLLYSCTEDSFIELVKQNTDDTDDDKIKSDDAVR